jgi:hypothetical protein
MICNDIMLFISNRILKKMGSQKVSKLKKNGGQQLMPM